MTPSRTNPALDWLPDPIRFDLDEACLTFGAWFEGKCREMTTGKKPKPKHDPLVLLGVRKPKGMGGTAPVIDKRTGQAYSDPRQVVSQITAIPGVRVVKAAKTPNRSE